MLGADVAGSVAVCVGAEVAVGGGKVDVTVAGSISGKTAVGSDDSLVGVAYVPHNDEACPQEVNNMVAMMSMGNRRFTGNPSGRLYL